MLYFAGLLALSAVVSGYDMLYGEVTVDWDGMEGTVGVQIDLRTDDVFITMNGPTKSWTGIGFGGFEMAGRYAIVTRMNGHQEERILGDHNAGRELEHSTMVMENTMSDDGMMRMWRLKRPAVVGSGYYEFPNSMTVGNRRGDPVIIIVIEIIICLGREGDPGFNQHPMENVRRAQMPLRWACLPRDGIGGQWVRRCPRANLEMDCPRRRCEWHC